MRYPFHNGALLRAAFTAFCLFLIEVFAVAPHAHAAGRHHHHHHRARVTIDVAAPVARDPFALLGSLFQPPAALAQYGVERGVEAVGAAQGRVRGAASAILLEARHFLGKRNPTGFRGPWCAAFANLVLARTGHRHVRSLRAIDALRDGRRVQEPRPGDLAVLSFGRHHHVTFFARWGGRGFYGLGGNQHHRVRLSSYPISRVIAWVRPT